MYLYLHFVIFFFVVPESLQGCKLTAASMEVLSEVLTSGQSDLKKVDLTLNAVGPPGVAALCKALRHPGCKLQGLM